jgi:hypothetical protein
MAQQSRKRRQTKHRGNAAGMVEVRGRTGRKPTDQERPKPQSTKELARQRRLERLDREPTWRGAANRAAIAAGLFVVAVIVLGQRPATAFTLGALMLLIYIPLSFYTDLVIYNRRRKKKATAS